MVDCHFPQIETFRVDALERPRTVMMNSDHIWFHPASNIAHLRARCGRSSIDIDLSISNISEAIIRFTWKIYIVPINSIFIELEGSGFRTEVVSDAGHGHCC